MKYIISNGYFQSKSPNRLRTIIPQIRKTINQKCFNNYLKGNENENYNILQPSDIINLFYFY